MRSPDNTQIVQQNGFVLRLLLEEEHFNSMEIVEAIDEQGSAEEVTLTETLVDLDAKFILVSKNLEESTDFDEVAYFWTAASIIGPLVFGLLGILFLIY